MNLTMHWNLTHIIQRSRLEMFSGVDKPSHYCFRLRLGDCSFCDSIAASTDLYSPYHRVHIGRPHQVIILHPQEAVSAALRTVMHRTHHLGRSTVIWKVLGHLITKVYMQFYGLSGKPFAQFSRIVTFIPFQLLKRKGSSQHLSFQAH